MHIQGEMNGVIAHVTMIVEDYDEAIRFFTEKLDFELIEDSRLDDAKRWVLVRPKGSGDCSILLARASNESQRACVGNQTAGRVFLFLHTDDFWRDYNAMLERKINFVRPPSDEPYGIVAVFEDLYGNLWDLIERK